MKTTTRRTANFGPYILDLRSGELRKFGTRVKMGEQSFRILCVLLENPGELVTREELRTKLWADDTFVDFDHGLNSAVQRLRDCLSDSAASPRWVETISRRGYRFIGKVGCSESTAVDAPPESSGSQAEELHADAPAPTANPPHLTAKQTARGKNLWIFAFLGAGILLFVSAIPFTRWIRERQTKRQAQLIRSIAVLPLDNFSSDPGQEFFADGMTDELITMLAKNHSLRVTSRTSVMQYKKAHRPLSEIARELGVDGILEGSVGRQGNRVRVTAQLIYAPTDTHVWAESYDRDVNDVSSLQSEVAQAIAKQVGVSTAVSEKPEKSVGPGAHNAYLQGRYYWFAFETEKARQQFQKAIDLQPDYAAAWSGLADSYTLKAVMDEVGPEAVMPQAEEAAEKSVALDDSSAESHKALAAVYFFYKWDWDAAERESARAIELGPSLAETHHLRSKILNALNRHEEALKEQEKAMELDPFARPWAMVSALVAARRYDDALREGRFRLEAQPNDAALHWSLSEAYRAKGMEKEFAQEWARMFELQGRPNLAERLREAYAKGGYRGVLEWNFEETKKAQKDNYISYFDFAQEYAMQGRRDDAIRYLNMSYEKRETSLPEIPCRPEFNFLHSDPRYQAILAKMGLPQSN